LYEENDNNNKIVKKKKKHIKTRTSFAGYGRIIYDESEGNRNEEKQAEE
jgi:hypothetical protein